MNSRIWLNNVQLDHTTAQNACGTYHTCIHGLECDLNLVLRPDGQLGGKLYTDGDPLELVGGISGYSGQGYGFLLEPESLSIIAVFRVWLEGRTFTLEVDVPDFSEHLMLSQSERITFERVPTLEFLPAPLDTFLEEAL
jgi:hypothetical protein